MSNSSQFPSPFTFDHSAIAFRSPFVSLRSRPPYIQRMKDWLMDKLISINDAAAQGIDRLRRPAWLMREDHIKIHIHEGKPGPFVKIYSPFNQECNGRDPVEMLIIAFDLEDKIFLPYTGPLPGDEAYEKKVKHFAGSLSGGAAEVA